MRKIADQLRIAFIAAASLLALSGHAAELPTAVVKMFPPGYVLMTYVPADINGDGKTDYIVVLHSKTEDAMIRKDQPAPPRPLLVFLQGEENTFTIVGRNDKVVFAADEGGQCDPFLSGEEGVIVKLSYFTVQNSVACGAHWTDYFTFRYSKELRDVVFHKRIYENWVMNPKSSANGDALVLGSRKVVTAQKNRPVLLRSYVPEP